jgi:ABC-type lipoprotein export system ATPase subunit|tara:strand:- start:87 stop:755 length:669 start_codon:yes stop_codon:yes gene_type:complete
MLNLKNISQSYLQGDSIINVLSKLNFSVNGVKNIGVIGPSGSGKSTFLNILGMIETPTSGEYILKGNNCLNLSQNLKTEIRKKFIGYIFQNNQLLEDFNVLENIAFPLILNGESFGDAKKKSLTLLAKLGLTNKKFIKPGLLSGGEQQRIAIARALIKNPILLLADEPTGSLDKNNSSLVMDLILSLAKTNNTVSIIATHNLEIIKRLDICYKIEKGKLIEI